MQRIIAPSEWVPVLLPRYVFPEAGINQNEPLQACVGDGRIVLEPYNPRAACQETVVDCDGMCFRCEMKDICKEIRE